VLPTPPFTLYVATTFIDVGSPAAGALEHAGHGPLGGRCREAAERAGELGPRGAALPGEALAEPTRGEPDTGRGRGAEGPHDVAQLGVVHVGVLVVTEALLQRLQLADHDPARSRGEQRPEALEHVAQALRLLAQEVEVVGGGGRGDGAAAPD